MQALDRKDAEQDANGRRLLSRAKARNIRPGAETAEVSQPPQRSLSRITNCGISVRDILYLSGSAAAGSPNTTSAHRTAYGLTGNVRGRSFLFRIRPFYHQWKPRARSFEGSALTSLGSLISCSISLETLSCS